MSYVDYVKGYGFKISEQKRDLWTRQKLTYYDNCIFSIDSLLTFFKKNKRYLSKKEKEIIDELNAVCHQVYTSYTLCEYEKFISSRLKRDIKKDIVSKYDNYTENNMKTIIGNVINRKTGLPIGYFYNHLEQKGYILYVPNLPWEATAAERKLKTKEDIDKILNKAKEELKKLENDKNPQNDSYAFKYSNELRL